MLWRSAVYKNYNSDTFIFELLPFIDFQFELLSGLQLPNYISYQLETTYTDRTHYGEVQYIKTTALLLLFF